MSFFPVAGVALCLVCVGVPLYGCGEQVSVEHSEGRRVLDVLHVVRRSSRQAEAHRDAVARLADVEVTDERVLRVRDTCVSGHRALLGAEAEAVRARGLLERLGADAAETRDAIERGNSMALEAEREISRCAAQSMSLGMRISYQPPSAP